MSKVKIKTELGVAIQNIELNLPPEIDACKDEARNVIIDAYVKWFVTNSLRISWEEEND